MKSTKRFLRPLMEAPMQARGSGLGLKTLRNHPGALHTFCSGCGHVRIGKCGCVSSKRGLGKKEA